MFFQGLAQEETGNEYYVDSANWQSSQKGTAEQPFKTIQAAIDYASDGDTLFVFGGLYKEHIIIDKELHLWGGVEGKEFKESVIKDKSDKRYSVEIIADYVKFQDFYLTDEDDYKTSPIGSLIYIKAENVVINGNTFNNTDSYGIVIDSDADGTIISGNRINNTKRGLYVESSTNDIVNNFITNCSDAGIHLYSTAHNRLFDNKIDTCLNGIKGEGYTVNAPLSRKTGEKTIQQLMDEIFKPIAKQFKPDIILVSSGYDTHYSDRLGGLHVGIDYFGEMIRQMREIQPKIVLTIEGGYNLNVIGNCFLSQISMLCDKPMFFEDNAPASIETPLVVKTLKENLKFYWDL